MTDKKQLTQAPTRAKAERGSLAKTPDVQEDATSRLCRADTYPSDWQLFRRLRFQTFRGVRGSHRVGTAQVAGHRVHVRVHCLPAQFWRFRITGPNFRGEVSTGSGALVDYWWAVEALLQGQVRVTRLAHKCCGKNDAAYVLSGPLAGEQRRRLRELLAQGMLEITARP